MPVIALYNIKGGVGKTAAAVNLAYLSAKDDRTTLLFDLDPQSAATFYFRIKPGLRSKTRKLLKGQKSILGSIKGTDYDGLDMIPSDFAFRKLDIWLDHCKKSTHQLSKVLKPLKKQYDMIFLDCPPNITLLSENVFRAADMLLVPTIPTVLSVRTLKQLQNFLKRKKYPSELLPFCSMVEKRKKIHREIMEELNAMNSRLLSTTVPYLAEIEKMGLKRAPLAEFAPSSRAANSYQALWNEVQSKIRFPAKS